MQQLSSAQALMIGIVVTCLGAVIYVVVRGYAVETHASAWVLGILAVVWITLGIMYDRPV